MADPIEVQIRDEIVSLMQDEINVSNGYQFDIGSINVYEEANAIFPRYFVEMPDEETYDTAERGINHLLYYNDNTFRIKAEFKNIGDVDEQDSHKEASRLREDIKRFFGKYYKLACSGAFEVLLTRTKKMFSNNVAYPTGIIADVKINYRQYRDDPSQAG